MTAILSSNLIEVIDDKLKKDDTAILSSTSITKWLGKQGISKLTLVIALVPPTICALIVQLLHLKVIYILIFIGLYFVAAFWLVDKKFNFLLKYIEKAKDYIKGYV